MDSLCVLYASDKQDASTFGMLRNDLIFIAKDNDCSLYDFVLISYFIMRRITMNQTDIERSTILIVDDTPESIDVLVESLEEIGFRLLVAQCANDVFERIANVRPDIILLDIMMPGTDGFEICRRLKADEEVK